MKYELQLQMDFRSAFGELKRQSKDNVSCSVYTHNVFVIYKEEFFHMNDLTAQS
jgi:hypothetical protein